MSSSSMVSALQKIGWDLTLKSLEAEASRKNVLLSPLSITIALAMLAGGATDDRQQMFASVLGFKDAVGIVEDVAQLIRPLGAPLKLANAVFREDNFQLLESYTQHLSSLHAESVSFPPPLAASCADINDWIASHTMDMIQNMLNPRDLEQISLVLLNAIAFKGEWLKPFEPEHTKPHSFESSAVKVQMMHSHMSRRAVLQAPSFVAVELPFGQGNAGYSMRAYLPNKGVSLDQVIASIASQTPGARFEIRMVKTLGLPKFEFERRTMLNDLLSQVGCPIEGNYLRISAEGAGPPTALHVARIEVDEKGAKAAAVTAVMIPRGAPLRDDPHPLTVIFDRPFVFSIVHNGTGALAFSGIYLQPSSEGS